MLAKTEVASTEIALRPITEGTEIAGRYRILSLIGEGGMGAVYRAQHLHLRKLFALKVLQPRNIDRPDVIARFEREAIAAGRIEHPNVVPATDFGRLSDGSFFLVLEFVNGRDLRSELKAGAMQAPRALRIMRGVVAGVRAAHDKGIVHRDLKPENIMLVERDGQRDFVKLLDFGVARIEAGHDGHQLTEAGTMLGTPRYMSPEQILGRAVDARTDLYSLGVILFELLTGQCPFAGNLPTLLEQHVTLPSPELPPALVTEQPRLAEIVRVLLSKNPENRFQTASELATALDEVSRETSRNNDVRSASAPYWPGVVLRRAGRFLWDVGRGAPSSMSKLASATSAVASGGATRVRGYVARWRRGRRNRALVQTVDRKVARSVLLARQVGRRLAAWGRDTWARTLVYGRAEWRFRSRGWKVVTLSAAAIGLLAIVVVTIKACQGPAMGGASGRSDVSGPRHGPPPPTKSSKSRR
jgi:serine/threonine-protein kinase